VEAESPEAGLDGRSSIETAEAKQPDDNQPGPV
jgi:hypothetical protein